MSTPDKPPIRSSDAQQRHGSALRALTLPAIFAMVSLLTGCDVYNLGAADASLLQMVQQTDMTATPSEPAPDGSGTDMAPAASGSGVICPVPGSRFTDTWGAPRSGGRGHEGVDMMAPHGTPVLAPVAGVVKHKTSSLGGLGFWLTDAAGDQYFGTHLQSFGQEGQVEAGTVIGYVGSSGNASANAPHLHFEYHPGGNSSANPTPLVTQACS